jgi:hypothetical protein
MYGFTVKSILVPLLARPRVAHAIKWTVYLALFLNFAFYIRDDLMAMQASLAPDAGLWKQLETFATSIDVAAWLLLLAVLELETHVISDAAYTRVVERVMLAVRLLCYISILSAAWGYLAVVQGYYVINSLEGVEHTCDLADRELYLQTGMVEYEEITSAVCRSMPAAHRLVRADTDESVIARETLPQVRFMSGIDVLNAWAWLLVVFLIEAEIRLQSADRFGSRALPAIRRVKSLTYLVLIGNGIIWLFTGYPLYAWDAFLWIFGFWAIELNLAEWEQERREMLEVSNPA